MLERITDRAITRDPKDAMGYEPTYSGVTSFLRRRYTKDLTGVDVAVSGVSLDTATTNRPGARFGPRGLRAASTNLAWFGGPGHWQSTRSDPVHRRLWRLLLRSVPQEIVGAIEAHATVILDAGATC
jgi:agmatinase